MEVFGNDGAIGFRAVPAEVTATGAEPAFGRILCAIDGNPPSAEAARQAAVLAHPGGEVELIAITSDDAAAHERALGEACRAVADAGVSATQSIVPAADPTDVLLEKSAGHDVIVVGNNDGSRSAGVFLGRTASALVHRAEVPVLVAKAPPAAAAFPAKILLASDGSPGSDRAATLATRIASAHHADATVIHVNDAEPIHRQALARQTAALWEATGNEPPVIEASGDVDEQIAGFAARLGVSLVVIGSRGLEGFRAIWSVSERVVRECPCSVLVARPPQA